jgi:transcriptional regulator with XRE-family HTH domain
VAVEDEERSLGTQLMWIRRERKLTVAQLAQKADVDLDYLQRLEADQILAEEQSGPTLHALAKVLKVSLWHLLRCAGVPEPQYDFRNYMDTYYPGVLSPREVTRIESKIRVAKENAFTQYGYSGIGALEFTAAEPPRTATSD